MTADAPTPAKRGPKPKHADPSARTRAWRASRIDVHLTLEVAARLDALATRWGLRSRAAVIERLAADAHGT